MADTEDAKKNDTPHAESIFGVRGVAKPRLKTPVYFGLSQLRGMPIYKYFYFHIFNQLFLRSCENKKKTVDSPKR